MPCDHVQAASRTGHSSPTSPRTRTGELFLYVNDAVLTLPGLTDMFYKNNSGKAKVTVTRIVAEEIVPPPTAAGVQARLRDNSPKPGDQPLHD